MEEIKFDDKIIALFTNVIRQIVKDEIHAVMKEENVERFSDLSVTEISNDASIAVLKDLATGEIFRDVPNYTGIRLKQGDIVRMYTDNQHSTSYIGETFGDRSKTLCGEYIDARMEEFNKQIKR